jgi:hypothetical protein
MHRTYKTVITPLVLHNDCTKSGIQRQVVEVLKGLMFYLDINRKGCTLIKDRESNWSS